MASVVVESWAPGYGAPIDLDEALEPTWAEVDPDIELAAERWTPLDPPAGASPAACVHVVDGIRRVDARVWITETDGTARLGLCASYAAGAVRCDARASLSHAEVRRGLFGPAGSEAIATSAGTFEPRTVAGDAPEQLLDGLRERMRDLEAEVSQRLTSAAGDGPDGDLVLVDGPLRGHRQGPTTIGYVKTHRVGYLPGAAHAVVAQLAPGQRSPLFVTQSTWSRYSWYLRLPGGAGHPWAGVVRCEASADLALPDARALADTTALTLPRFASAPHKDPRAPQNLYPIAALERALRRRLGDPAHVLRALRVAVSRRAARA